MNTTRAWRCRFVFRTLFMGCALLSVVADIATKHGFSQEPVDLSKIPRVMRPDAAVALAWQDAQAIAAIDPKLALGTRYVMINEPLMLEFEDGKPIDCTHGGLSLTANTTLLHTAEPWRLGIVQPGGLYRLNLADMVGEDVKKLRLILDAWERMTDNQFYLQTDKIKTITCPPTLWKGKAYTSWNILTVVPAAHVNEQNLLGQLCTLTATMVPIISAGQFSRFLLDSDFGGLYPEFRGFNLAPSKGTAEEAFLARAGVDLKVLGNNNSDQRVFLIRKPTSSPGIIEYVPTAITQPAVGPTIATITRDFFTGFIDQNKHPLENLGDRKHDGTEIFLPTPAGGLEFALFDANGGFVRSAPLNPPNSLAWDSTIPKPFLPILQGPGGCIRCHTENNPQTNLFAIYQPAPNYVTYMRNLRVGDYQFDIFADKGDGGQGLKRLVSLYKGETSSAFTWAGRTYAKFVLESSRLPLEQACRASMAIHDRWLYSYVTPSKALLTLGYKVEDEFEAVNVFNTICPPAPEPLRITQIRAWAVGQELPMTIDDWLSVYPEVALRVLKWEQTQGSALPLAQVPNAAQTPEASLQTAP